MCNFGAGALNRAVIGRLLRAITGRERSDEQLEKVGARVDTLERMFNLREGLGRAEDTLPGRLMSEPMPSGPSEGQVVDLEPLKDDGYAALGWDREGVPTEHLLRELNLQGLVG